MLDQLLTLPDDPIAAPGARLRLRRAWPRDAGHLVVEYRRDDGGLVPGQWFGDAAEARRVADQTTRRCPGTTLRLVAVEHGLVVLQPGGADRRLTGLRDVLAEPGTDLVSHRPERRAVARRDRAAGTSYVKVVRPARVREVLGPLRALAAIGGRPFELPRIEEADEARGAVTLSALPGTSLHDRPAAAETADVWRRVGTALRWLHQREPTEAPEHGSAQEIALIRSRLDRVRPFVPTVARAIAPVIDEVCVALAAGTGAPACLHRDFHDKQVVVDDAGGIGLLDFDTFAVGEAALDVANMIAHLELRTLQARADAAVGVGHAAAFLEGYEPASAVRSRVAPYVDATRVRLACLYAVRPRWAHLAGDLVARVGKPSALNGLIAS